MNFNENRTMPVLKFSLFQSVSAHLAVLAALILGNGNLFRSTEYSKTQWLEVMPHGKSAKKSFSKPAMARGQSTNLKSTISATQTQASPTGTTSFEKKSEEALGQVVSENESASYLKKCHQMISDAKFYPTVAKRQALEGTVIMELTILSNGIVENVQIITKSGVPVLDRAAESLLASIRKFPPPPDGSLTTLRIPIQYKLNAG
jgi:TonB family protein